MALAILLMIGLVIIMAFYYAAAGWLVARLSAGKLSLFAIVGPAVWVLMEWLRGWLMSGFPWMTLGYSQIDSPLASFAPVLGIYGVSLALMISASAALATLLSSGNKRIIFAVLSVLPWAGGAALAQYSWTEPVGALVKTTIVQGGISQDKKWLPEQFRPTLDLYRHSIIENVDSDLVIWPEVAIPSLFDQVEGFISLVESDISGRGQMLLFGILEREQTEGKTYNSVFAIDGETRQVYRKRHLVPFGEYFPVPDFVREWMRLMSLPYNDISSGEAQQQLIVMPDGNRLSVAISAGCEHPGQRQ